MKHFTTILSHEIRMLLVSASTYIAAVLFLAFMGFIFSGVLESYSSSAQETSPASVFFQLFWLPVWFMVPLLTMKCLAEERRLGTLETLLTAPVSTTEVVLGKYFAAYFLYMLLWGSTGGFFYILHRFAGDSRFIDMGPLLGGYLFIAVSGLLYVALGVFASSLTRNQAVAGIFAFVMLFAITIGLRFVSTMEVFNLESMSGIRAAIDYSMVFRHLDDFTRGVVDTRQLLFYVSGTVLALIFSILGVEAKLIHS
ncbi:ABC transporter permease [Rariglobus hedericola]|uniref:ABC transporter permease subunit n=1 Tax=Rariglobus hedericola TaxID=2597822 RepID=A0A556QR33_9BACT|nr:ABC transporter permease [Rariglobus hedericola]TSJ79096.1 ABC transporter permease subunit [Rariglobus hedericola]